MLIELLLKPLFWLVGLILNLLPDASAELDLSGIGGLIDFLAFGFQVFPLSLFVIIIGNILFWLNFQMIYGFAKWIYNKIPGVN